MTPLAKWVRNRIEKYLDRHYEGPSAPNRLRDQVVMFANLFRRATRSEWVEFAARSAEEAYRAGYTRGLEWAERDPEALDPRVPPEVAMSMIDPDWEWSEPVDLQGSGKEVVLEVRAEPERITDQYRARSKARPRRF